MGLPRYWVLITGLRLVGFQFEVSVEGNFGLPKYFCEGVRVSSSAIDVLRSGYVVLKAWIVLGGTSFIGFGGLEFSCSMM